MIKKIIILLMAISVIAIGGSNAWSDVCSDLQTLEYNIFLAMDKMNINDVYDDDFGPEEVRFKGYVIHIGDTGEGGSRQVAATNVTQIKYRVVYQSGSPVIRNWTTINVNGGYFSGVYTLPTGIITGQHRIQAKFNCSNSPIFEAPPVGLKSVSRYWYGPDNYNPLPLFRSQIIKAADYALSVQTPTTGAFPGYFGKDKAHGLRLLLFAFRISGEQKYLDGISLYLDNSNNAKCEVNNLSIYTSCALAEYQEITLANNMERRLTTCADTLVDVSIYDPDDGRIKPFENAEKAFCLYQAAEFLGPKYNAAANEIVEDGILSLNLWNQNKGVWYYYCTQQGNCSHNGVMPSATLPVLSLGDYQGSMKSAYLYKAITAQKYWRELFQKPTATNSLFTYGVTGTYSQDGPYAHFTMEPILSLVSIYQTNGSYPYVDKVLPIARQLASIQKPDGSYEDKRDNRDPAYNNTLWATMFATWGLTLVDEHYMLPQVEVRGVNTV